MTKGLRYIKYSRIMAAFLVALFIVTYYMTAISNVKAETTYTVVTEGIDEQYLANMGENLLAGKTPRIFSTLNGNKVEIARFPAVQEQTMPLQITQNHREVLPGAHPPNLLMESCLVQKLPTISMLSVQIKQVFRIIMLN